MNASSPFLSVSYVVRRFCGCVVLDAIQPSCEHVQMEGPELALEKEAEKEIMCRIRRKKKPREGHSHPSHLWSCLPQLSQRKPNA